MSLFLIFLVLPLSSSLHSSMGAKHTLRSSSLKVVEASTPKINRPSLGGNENPSIEEQWIVPPFFED